MRIKKIVLDYAGVITPTKDNYTFAQKYCDHFKMKPLDLMKITYKNWDPASLNQIPASKFWSDVGKELNTDPSEIRDMKIG